MLFKEAFKPKAYSKIFGMGYYTPVGGWVTVLTRCGKQQAISATKIPEKIFNSLKLDDDKSISNLADFPCLSIVKDEDTGFKRLVYTDPNKKTVENEDAGED